VEEDTQNLSSTPVLGPRNGLRMAYDSAHAMTVMFGGRDKSDASLGELGIQ
jgi:hypothetical protein